MPRAYSGITGSIDAHVIAQFHSWPGVDPGAQPEHLAQGPAPAAAPAGGGDSLDVAALVEALLERGGGRLHEQVIAAVERVLLTRVLRHTHGHQAQASELLGLSRATLRHRLRALGLAVDKTLTDVTSDGPGAS
jgi:two-component system, NtrC family, nitrogen regulation response regulator GlnG